MPCPASKRASRALRRDGEDFQPGCTLPTGGIEMNADEDRVRIFSGHGRTGLEGYQYVRFRVIARPSARPVQAFLKSSCHRIERKILLIAERAERAAVMTAMAGVEHHRRDRIKSRNRFRPQCRREDSVTSPPREMARPPSACRTG